MSIAVSPVLPSRPLTIPLVRRRIAAVPTTHIAGAVLVTLVGGILASIVTTTDPLWWQLHFSQLGTFHDLSGVLFNTTLKVSGALVVVFAVRVRRDLARLGPRAVRRGAPRAVQVFLSVIGVNLALVGCIPLTVNKSVHDKVAGAMVLGFAALLLTSPVLLHRLPRRLAVATAMIFVVLFASAALFVTTTINLTSFEVVAFGTMFAWTGVFLHGVAQRTAEMTADAAPPVSRTADAASPEASDAPPAPATGTLPGRTVRWRAVGWDAVRWGTASSGAVRPAGRPSRTMPWRAVPAATGVTTGVATCGSGPSGRSARHRRRGPRPARRGARVVRADARVRLRRGCRGWAARAASRRWTTPVHR